MKLYFIEGIKFSLRTLFTSREKKEILECFNQLREGNDSMLCDRPGSYRIYQKSVNICIAFHFF